MNRIDAEVQVPETASKQRDALIRRYHQIRTFSAELCETLQAEDFVIQSMPDVSPTRWHLAHTTWFFETFVLSEFQKDYRPVDEAYAFLFNSYYNTVGRQFPRAQRGLLSRPTVDQVWAYRQAVDERLTRLLDEIPESRWPSVSNVVQLGLHHEQQHQELILTDLKHVFSCNPMNPAYCDIPSLAAPEEGSACSYTHFPRQLARIGHAGDGFVYDNERPNHERLVLPYRLASRLVTNGEYLEFIADEGYGRPELWLSMGWNFVQQAPWQAPLYWQQVDQEWFVFSLGGLHKICEHEPVCHISYFEADAYARWRGLRLPTEFEWELAVSDNRAAGNFVESGRYHPQPSRGLATPDQMWGDVWEWTSSSYSPYPGYRPDAGALGEYNGKFMCNQYVLRGGSCATSHDHIRATYRNFFPPESRWQFSGLRLAGDDA